MSIVFDRGAVGPEYEPWSLLKPGQWCSAPEFYWSAGWAFSCCPNGHVGTISQRHHCTDEGLLLPSYVCPQEGCTFHDYVFLSTTPKPAPPSLPVALNPTGGQT